MGKLGLGLILFCSGLSNAVESDRFLFNLNGITRVADNEVFFIPGIRPEFSGITYISPGNFSSVGGNGGNIRLFFLESVGPKMIYKSSGIALGWSVVKPAPFDGNLMGVVYSTTSYQRKVLFVDSSSGRILSKVSFPGYFFNEGQLIWLGDSRKVLCWQSRSSNEMFFLMTQKKESSFLSKRKQVIRGWAKVSLENSEGLISEQKKLSDKNFVHFRHWEKENWLEVSNPHSVSFFEGGHLLLIDGPKESVIGESRILLKLINAEKGAVSDSFSVDIEFSLNSVKRDRENIFISGCDNRVYCVRVEKGRLRVFTLTEKSDDISPIDFYPEKIDSDKYKIYYTMRGEIGRYLNTDVRISTRSLVELH